MQLKSGPLDNQCQVGCGISSLDQQYVWDLQITTARTNLIKKVQNFNPKMDWT